MRVVLVVNAASVHHALPVEQLQIGSDEDSILFEGLGADLLAVIQLSDGAVDALFLQDLPKLTEVPVDHEAVCLPHGGLEVIIGDQ